MTTSTLAIGIDSAVEQANNARNYGSLAWLSLSNTAGSVCQSFLFFGGLPPAGAYVFSATLTVCLRGAWTGGPHVITAERIVEAWKESNITYANRPAVSTNNPATASVTGGVDRQAVTLDVTQLVRDMLAAGKRYGVRLRLSTSGRKTLSASDSGTPGLRPTLVVVWATSPTVATDLVPDDGQAVSLPGPTLGWSFFDIQGDDQGDYRVQVTNATDPTFAAPLWDSGVVVSSDPFVDLAARGAPNLAAGGSFLWRVKARDVNGLDPGYSAAAPFVRTTKGTLAINAPTNVVESTTPDITHTFSGRTQSAVRYFVDEQQADGSWTNVWDSGRMPGSVTTYRVPPGKIKSATKPYRLTVRVWDTIDRIATPGDPVFVDATLVFNYAPAAGGPTPVTNLRIAALGPGVRLNFNRGVVPDTFALKVDGVVVVDDLDPLALIVGPDFQLDYFGATPRVAHVFEVVAVAQITGVLKSSTGNPTITYTPTPVGIWLVDEQATPPTWAQLLGWDPADLAIGESGATLYPIGRQDPLRIVDSIRGYEGSVSGVTDDVPTRDLLFAYKGRVGRVFRLVMADLAIRVVLADIAVVPHPVSVNVWAVSVAVVQVGDFAITPRR